MSITRIAVSRTSAGFYGLALREFIRSMSWDARSFRALSGPLPADPRTWYQAENVEFPELRGITRVDFVSAPDERRHRIVLEHQHLDHDRI